MCKPMNNKKLANYIDMYIRLENERFIVFGLTDEFEMVELGSFDSLLNAYGECCSYGFEVRTYRKAINMFEDKVVKFTLD